MKQPGGRTAFDVGRVLASEPGGGEVIGRSREGREMLGWRFGRGPAAVSLIAGCHADEPVGPMMLGRLAGFLRSLPDDDARFTQYTFHVVPEMNPDGAERNRPWSAGVSDAYDPGTYAANVIRELPGDDVEFGFPRDGEDAEARPENLAAAAFLRPGAPYALHVSFHGLAVGAGPWFLIDADWADRSAPLRARLSEAVAARGYALHDEERTGEKGFSRIAPGFCTRPDSAAMREYFLARGDDETAGKFRPSSMEFARSLGGDPLTLVSEMPLFLWDEPADGTDKRRHFSQALARGALRPMPISDQMALQVELLNAGLMLGGSVGRGA